jgi:hypothetical protein
MLFMAMPPEIAVVHPDCDDNGIGRQSMRQSPEQMTTFWRNSRTAAGRRAMKRRFEEAGFGRRC